MFGPHAAQAPGAEPEQPKFEKDFIMLSEFSELVGPVPVCIIPDDKAAGTFNTNHFAVRIMSSDFQTASGKLVGPDTQVVLSEKQDNAYAYVHYFSCNDMNARGYLRQYCFSYVTTSPHKIFDNFELLLERFSQVTSLLKAANHRIFQKDMTRYLADLQYTLVMLREEGLSESAEVDYSKLYSNYDFTKENVPERDISQVLKNMDDTKEILASLKEELERDESIQVWEELSQLREKYREQCRKEFNAKRNINSAMSDRASTEGTFTSYLPLSPEPCLRLSESLSSSESAEYEPKQVFTHYVNKFERRLRPLEELAPKAHPIAMETVKGIYKHFSRSEFVLAMEKEDAEFLDPCSSLLTVGRIPVMNFMRPPSTDLDSTASRCNSFCYSPQHRLSSVSAPQLPSTKWITSRNTWGLPMQQNQSHLVLDAVGAKAGFNTDFMGDKLGLKQYPLYIDPVYFGTRDPRPSIHNIADNEEEEGIDFAHDSSTYPSDEPLPESEQSGQYLSIPPGSTGTQSAVEEDVISRGSAASSTAFVTPEGLTPRSSDEEDSNIETVGKSQKNATKTKVSTSQKGSSRNSENGEMFAIPSLTVDREVDSSGAEGNVNSNDVGATESSCSTTKRPHEDILPPTGRNDLKVPGTVVARDLSLEASDDGYNHFHSESQSTLTESKEGVSGRGSREGSMSRTGVGGGNHVEGSSDPPVSNGGYCEVDGSWFQGVSSRNMVNGVDNDREERPPSCEALPPPYSSSISSITSGPKPPPYSSSPRGADRRVVAMLGHNESPISINSSMEYSHVVSSNCSAMVSANGFLPTNAGGQPDQFGVRPPPGGVGHSAGPRRPAGPVHPAGLGHSAGLRHPAGPGRSGGAGQLEESYSAGSGLNVGVSSSLGVGVSAEKLHGALSLVNGGMHSRDGRRGVDRADPDADMAPMFFMSPSDGGAENRGGGKGKGLWGRRGSRQRPLLGISYSKDKAMPQVFFSPSHGSHSSLTKAGGNPPCPNSPSEASLMSFAGQPYSMYPSIVSGACSLSSVATEYPDTSVYRGPSVVRVIGKTSLPLVSALDHIESNLSFKPGKGILNFCKDIPVVKDLFYCLLHGRPLVLLGKQSEENLIRRLIRVLWLFVPGHSSQRQVVTWQDTPLDIRDLSRVRLVGLNKSTAPLEPHIKRYVSYWDCTSGKLFTPAYNGELLSPIVTRTKDKKNEEVFLAHIHSVLLDIAMKAFVYYYGYPLHVSNFRRAPSAQEFSSKKYLIVQEKNNPSKSKARYLHQQFGIRGGDADIIEYFVEVIREQLSVDWGIAQLNGSPFDDGPVRLHLHMKACSESFSCKPKKPY